eukprot:1117140-Pelagomonas_calceolata.AAC.1
MASGQGTPPPLTTTLPLPLQLSTCLHSPSVCSPPELAALIIICYFEAPAREALYESKAQACKSVSQPTSSSFFLFFPAAGHCVPWSFSPVGLLYSSQVHRALKFIDDPHRAGKLAGKETMPFRGGQQEEAGLKGGQEKERGNK